MKQRSQCGYKGTYQELLLFLASCDSLLVNCDLRLSTTIVATCHLLHASCHLVLVTFDLRAGSCVLFLPTFSTASLLANCN